MDLTRRSLLGLSAGLPGLALPGCAGGEPDPGDGWRAGPVRHLLPSASERAFNLKLSLREPLAAAPKLRVSDRAVAGERMDTRGRFWAFRIGGLEPGREHWLELRDGGDALCDPWPLRTLPARDASPERLRVASFTCAGGLNLPTPPGLFHYFKPSAWRRALFDQMLGHAPDLVIANGDHVYFDLPAMERLQSPVVKALVVPFVEGLQAVFDPALAVLGTANEDALTAVGDDQITSIYGTRFRSTPVYFVTDDHDYFVNDDATPEGTTLPPSPFHAELRNALQRLYFPELFADDLPADVPGRVSGGGLALSTHFGEIRFGDLFAGLVYDCGGYLSLGERAGLVPPAVEAWLLARTRAEDTRHLAHLPSHPMGWTAGKWREWYPDWLENTGSRVEAVGRDEHGNKLLWQPGWFRQHQALLAALSAQRRRRALVVSGDLHALGAVRIERSGELDLAANPVHAVLSGPVGVGDAGWPSAARGVETRVAEALGVAPLLALDERNGFTLLDFDRDRSRARIFGAPPGWTAPERLSFDTPLDLELA